MLKEVADDKKIGKEIVQAAIKAVKEKGWDVNPYTVADEAKVSRTQLVRDSDLMNMIAEAKGGAAAVSAPVASGTAVDEAAQARVKELEEKLSQLEQEHKGLLEETKRLEDECFDREDRILELEAKCTDLEHEAETLAVQLQNTWNVAYQKGVSDGAAKARDEMLNETGPQKAFSPPGHLQLNEKTQPAVPEPKPEKAPEPTPQPVPQPTPEPVPLAEHQPQEVETHSGPHWERHLDPASKVFNVAKAGPYVASSFNPLDNLSWKDLETVYHFRVSSLKEVTKGLAGSGDHNEAGTKDSNSGIWNAQAQKSAQHASSSTQRPSSPKDTHPTVPAQPQPDMEARKLTPPKQSYLDFDSPENATPPAQHGEHQPAAHDTPPFVAELHSESALDLDQMDIFESLEDIEDLGHIDVIEDVQPSSTLYQTTGDYSPFEGPAYNYRPSPTESLTNLPAMKAPQPSVPELPPNNKEVSAPPQATEPAPAAAQQEPDDVPKQDAVNDTASQQAELADLIKSRIAQSKEMSMEYEPSVTPPPAGEGAKAGPAAGGGMKSKFVGGKAAAQAPASGDSAAPGNAAPAGGLGAGKGFTPKVVPPEIRKSCFVLGLRPDDLTVAMVNEAWKKQITTPGVHPDQGGDTEYAVHLNTAKDTLTKWLDNQGPKLGKKFGKDKEGGGGPIVPKKPGS